MITLSQDSEALARRLAAAQSVSIEDAIRQALEARARETGLAARPFHDTSPEAPQAAECTRLNLCDCAAYALAKTSDAPLLFKGNDFSMT